MSRELKFKKMKNLRLIVLVNALLLMATFTSCKKEPVLPTIITSPVGNIGYVSATSGGYISDDGGADITARGVVWNTSPYPTTANYSISDSIGSGTGNFTCNLTGLTPNATYYVRSYAINSAGTAYGDQQTFSAISISIPTISTAPVSNIGYFSATSGGNISDDGGAEITARGIVWNTSPNPTTANNSISDNTGSGTGNFTCNLTGLTASATYYVRSYAINSAGTAYGDQREFSALSISNPGAGVSYNGYTYSSVVLDNGQEWMAENLRTANYRNGDPIETGLSDYYWGATTAGAYAIYNNYNANNTIYGKLYNWYAVTDFRKLCPIGWHVPTDGEWTTLTDFLGGEYQAGDKMRSIGTQYWVSNLDATNESGFSGLPGGYRNDWASFYDVGNYGYWWSSSSSSSTVAWSRALYYGADVVRYSYDKQNGFSVRCLKD